MTTLIGSVLLKTDLHIVTSYVEFAFCLLVWWIVNASPANGCTSEIRLIGLLVPLVGTTNTRYLDISSNHDLDPTYTPLSELLLQLGQALEDDLHWHQTTDILYTYSEFLHEVFQRYI